MAAQEASQPLRWRYGDVDEGNFAVRPSGVPLLVGLLALLVCFVAICVYLRWACRRYNVEATLPSSSSSSSSSSTDSSSVSGLDAAAIAGLPVTLYQRPLPSPGADQDDDAAQCSICLGELAEGEKVKAMPRCGHCFHPDCVDAWLRSRPSCPLCRGSLLVASTEKDVGSEAV